MAASVEPMSSLIPCGSGFSAGLPRRQEILSGWTVRYVAQNEPTSPPPAPAHLLVESSVTGVCIRIPTDAPSSLATKYVMAAYVELPYIILIPSHGCSVDVFYVRRDLETTLPGYETHAAAASIFLAFYKTLKVLWCDPQRHLFGALVQHVNDRSHHLICVRPFGQDSQPDPHQIGARVRTDHTIVYDHPDVFGWMSMHSLGCTVIKRYTSDHKATLSGYDKYDGNPRWSTGPVESHFTCFQTSYRGKPTFLMVARVHSSAKQCSSESAARLTLTSIPLQHDSSYHRAPNVLLLDGCDKACYYNCNFSGCLMERGPQSCGETLLDQFELDRPYAACEFWRRRWITTKPLLHNSLAVFHPTLPVAVICEHQTRCLLINTASDPPHSVGKLTLPEELQSIATTLSWEGCGGKYLKAHSGGGRCKRVWMVPPWWSWTQVSFRHFVLAVSQYSGQGLERGWMRNLWEPHVVRLILQF